MPNYLKKATKTAHSGADEVRIRVQEMLDNIESGGEKAARQYARDLDKWEGEIVVGEEALNRAEAQTPPEVREDIHFAAAKVRQFAEAQKASLGDVQTEISKGVFAGHRHVPMECAGCYVPGGRYAHVASAIMSTTTAKVAGVENIIACSPPTANYDGAHPAILYALRYCGASKILNLGGVQGIAALAFGLFDAPPADILVGPGNQYVAEAKRLLYGRTGIDMFAGPTEILVIADDTADPDLVACDLAGQAEHGPNSPAWLIALSESFAKEVLARLPSHLESLPEPNRTHALTAWQDYGEVVVTDGREEAAKVSDQYAAEHVEVHCADLEWWLMRLRNYGSLFLGEETTVAFGDKTSGPNHILPTRGAARYTGGLSVAKFMKTVTWQRMEREACREIAATTARISRLEGMEGHARTADLRLAKWFANETFNLKPPRV